jgi:hypothetical protein
MVLQDMLNQDFRIRGKTLGGYSDEFLKSLYDPGEIDSIYKTGSIARSVGLNTNPSGTAAVTEAAHAVEHPLLSIATKTAPAAATNSPGFNAWMTRTSPPLGAGAIADAVRKVTPARGRFAAAMGANQSQR